MTPLKHLNPLAWQRPTQRKALLALLLLALAWGAPRLYWLYQFEHARTMSEDLFKPDTPNTQCLGRIVIDLPKEATLFSTTFEYRGATSHITETDYTKLVDYKKTVQEFEAKLRSTKHEIDPSLLKAVHDVPDGGKVFVHWEEDFSTVGLRITSHLWRNGVHYVFVTDSSLANLDKAVQDALWLQTVLRPKKANEIPSEPGFCLKTAFIPDDAKGEGFESGGFYVQMKEWRKVAFSVDAYPQRVKEPTSLEQRVMVVKGAPRVPFSPDLIRHGPREMAGLAGYELVMLSKELETQPYLYFRWEFEGELNRNDPPTTKVEMRAFQEGEPDEISQAKALALWEYLMKHVRLRQQTSPLQTSQAAPDAQPLGTLAATGRICPQTGLWRCAEEARPIQGGREQWLRQGELMPKAQMQSEPTLWQRLRGQQPTHAVATVWALVGYERTAVQPKPRASLDPSRPGPSEQGGKPNPDPADPQALPEGEDKA